MPFERKVTVDLIDTESAGDISRIVVGGIAPPPGESLLEQARYLEQEADGLRQALLSEPHGDPTMSVDLIVPPKDPRAEAGYIIMEAMGYPVFSGSNTICTVTALLESGHLAMAEGEREVLLESPAGLVRLWVDCARGRVRSVRYQTENNFVAARDQTLELPQYGKITFDLVWGGVLYAVVGIAQTGRSLVAEQTAELAALGAALVEAVRPTLSLHHPVLSDLGPLSFVHFVEDLEDSGPGFWRSRTASYVHPGVICHSPTGTGTSARLALHADRGELAPGDTLETISPFGTCFRGRLGPRPVEPSQGYSTEITGSARILGRGELSIDL